MPHDPAWVALLSDPSTAPTHRLHVWLLLRNHPEAQDVAQRVWDSLPKALQEEVSTLLEL
jgi:hypothetical protein